MFEYAWKFIINGEEKGIVTYVDFPQVDGEFIGLDTKLIQYGYLPPFLDFTIENEDENLIDEFIEVIKNTDNIEKLD